MKIRIKSFIYPKLLLLSILLFSCQKHIEKKALDNAGIEIKVRPTSDLFDWSGVIKNVTTIPLETNRGSLFRSINKLAIYDDNVYILDVISSKLLSFSSAGKFIGMVGSRGKGSQEYREMRDFAFTSEGLYTLDYQRIHFFDNDDILKIAKTTNLSSIQAFNPGSFCLSGEVMHLWCSNPDSYNPDGDSYYRLYSFKDNQPFHKMFEYDHKIFDGPRFYHNVSDDSYFLKPPDGDNTVYRVKGDSVEALYQINYLEDGLPTNYFDQQERIDLNAYLKSDYFKNHQNFWRVGDFLYFNSTGPGSFTYEGLYNTRTNKMIKFGKRDWPFNPIIVYSDGQSLYGYYEKQFLIRYEGQSTDNVVYGLCKSRLDSMTIDDNPLLVKIELNLPDE